MMPSPMTIRKRLSSRWLIKFLTKLVSTKFSYVKEYACATLIQSLQGITFSEELPEALAGTPALEEKTGTGKVAVEAEVGDTALSELEARLNNLKR